MKIRAQLGVCDDDGHEATCTDVAVLEKACQRIEHLGLPLPEAKQILAALQQRLVEQQTSAFVAARSQCEHCGKSLGIKGYHTRTLRTLFGTVTLTSPRLYHCRCQRRKTATLRPLNALLTESVAPELLFMETNRYWPRRDSRRGLATPATPQGQGYLTAHREVPRLWPAKVAGPRRPYDGDGGDWSPRRGRDPTIGPRRATRLKRQGGRCAYGGRFFHHDDQWEVDHISGHRRNSRSNNLQVFHGHGHEAKTRAPGESLPVGRRDTHQDPEERSARKRARAVLEQRSAE
jgi:hypothetical protein